MQIQPIRTKDDYERALTRLEQLMSAKPETPEGDELDVLATLLDAYESKHYSMRPPSAIAAVEFEMDQRQLTRKDLEPMIGSRARISEVLGGRRPLSLTMVRRLKEGLGISADILIQTSPAGGSDLRMHAGSRRGSKRAESRKEPEVRVRGELEVRSR